MMSEYMENEKTFPQKLAGIPKALMALIKCKANAWFGVGESKLLVLARSLRTVGILIAVVITAFGVVEALNTTKMKAIFGLAKHQKLIAGDVMLYILVNYLVYALLALGIGVVCFYFFRYKDRKVKAAA